MFWVKSMEGKLELKILLNKRMVMPASRKLVLIQGIDPFCGGVSLRFCDAPDHPWLDYSPNLVCARQAGRLAGRALEGLQGWWVIQD